MIPHPGTRPRHSYAGPRTRKTQKEINSQTDKILSHFVFKNILFLSVNRTMATRSNCARPSLPSLYIDRIASKTMRCMRTSTCRFSFATCTLGNDFCDFYSILFYPITLEGRRGTTDEFATIPFHLDLFSAALVELAKSIPVHSLILSSHLFFCLPLFLFPFTVPCRIVFARPEDLETWPNHLRSGVRHILKWLLGSFCEPPHW